ncbi:MAG TPA: tryptophan 7-halogenase, partial [Abditibacteriaceae bacterium]
MRDFDLAIVGSGFGGSLLAMIARQLGLRVVLLEKGRHPRFAIGESSTPLANLLLEELATCYDLPRLKPFCKWGTWQNEYPEIACGLKRGFTFLHHEKGRAFSGARSEQLLVAASPHDDIADTHWYRPDFDQFFVEEAIRCGVEYIDEVSLDTPLFDGGITLNGTRHGQRVQLGAQFLIDATGPRGYLHRALNLAEEILPDLPPTQALYTQFEDVSRLDELGILNNAVTPYPADDAAVHHVFEGGWIWVLRFNNGLISAGIAARDELANELNFADGESAWRKVLERFPTIQRQFQKAQPSVPFIHAPRLAFCTNQIVGEKWAMLPSAAGFVDPLLSTGFPLTLLGITRLASMLENGLPRDGDLQTYAMQTRDELHITARLVVALYRKMDDFQSFRDLTLLYFAAASYSETARRLGKPHLAGGFLMHDHPTFGSALKQCLHGVSHTQILEAIKPIDVAGLTRSDRNSWYPVDADDLRRAAHKVEATPQE